MTRPRTGQRMRSTPVASGAMAALLVTVSVIALSEELRAALSVSGGV
jgi:hypothetical protein